MGAVSAKLNSNNTVTQINSQRNKTKNQYHKQKDH